MHKWQEVDRIAACLSHKAHLLLFATGMPPSLCCLSRTPPSVALLCPIPSKRNLDEDCELPPMGKYLCKYMYLQNKAVALEIIVFWGLNAQVPCRIPLRWAGSN